MKQENFVCFVKTIANKVFGTDTHDLGIFKTLHPTPHCEALDVYVAEYRRHARLHEK